MPNQFRGDAAMVGAAVLMVAIEAWALRAHTLGIVLIGVLAGVGLVVAAFGADLAKVGLGTAYACAFTLTWNGWFVGPVRPGDVLIAVSLLCFAIVAPATVFRSPPWWIKQLCYALVLGVVLIVLFPPDPLYLVQRKVVNAGGKLRPQQITNISFINVGVAAKFIVAVAAIPVMFTAASIIDRRALKRLPVAFALGAALSGLAAFIDHLRIASVGQLITGLPNLSPRQDGFALHPNFLAAGLCLAVPLAIWMILSRTRWERRLGAIALLCMLLGVYSSGSRGGAACAVGAIVVSFALHPRSRAQLPAILLAALAGAGVVAAVFPSLGLAVLRTTRLFGNVTTTGSDFVRAEVGAQGWIDFHTYPIHGIGLQASTQASQVYLQELASGGLLLFIAMSVYMLGAGWTAFRLVPRDPLAAAILASVITTLALDIFEADLTDRFYYVPEAILVALLVAVREGRHPVVDEPGSQLEPVAPEPSEARVGR